MKLGVQAYTVRESFKDEEMAHDAGLDPENTGFVLDTYWAL